MNAKIIQEADQNEASIPLAPKSKCIAFIQLNRLGDLIQTTQLARDLKNERPDIRLILICREGFGKGLSFLFNEVFNHVYYVSSDTFFGANTTNLDSAISNFSLYLGEINSNDIDIAINLSFSKSSAQLASLVSAKYYFGSLTDQQAQEQIKDPWSQYIFSTVMAGAYNQLALNDIFRQILGLKENQTVPVELNPRKNQIIFAPFASHRKKRWRTEKWAEVIYKTLKNFPNYEVHLIGSTADQEASKLISENPFVQSVSQNFKNQVGVLSIQELRDLMTESRLLVAHDSMASHLAAYTGLQSLTIALGTVRPLETAPYIKGSYVLKPNTKCFPCFPADECASFQCHSDISYQVVCSAIETLIQNDTITHTDLSQKLNSFHLGSFGLYKTDFSDGLLHFESLNKDETPSTKELMGHFYRMAWLYLLEEKEERMGAPNFSNQTKAELKTNQDGIKHLYELYQFGQDYSRYILEEIAKDTPDLSKIKEYGAKIDEIDQLSIFVGKQFQDLTPIVHFVTLRKANLEGEHIVHLTQSSFFTYNQGVLLCKILFELVQSCISPEDSKKLPSRTLDV